MRCGGIQGCRRRGVQRGCATRPAGCQPELTNCYSLWCSRVPASCCSSRPAASRGSEEMLCCQCWKSVRFGPAVSSICQRLKTLIELSCAGSCIRGTAAACPVDSHILLGIKHSCSISPVLTASATQLPFPLNYVQWGFGQILLPLKQRRMLSMASAPLPRL